MILSGVLAPIPTPFDDAGAVDAGKLRAALARFVEGPLTGFIILGSNGEAVLLDEDESDRVIAAAREVVPKGRTFIVGTGRESTQAAVRATKRAAELGADAVLVRTPGFFKSQMTNDAFVRHYTTVADASPVPVLLYNFTALTGVNLLPAAVSRLASHPNVVGMKESGGDILHIADLVSGTPDEFSVFAGSASTFYPALAVGCVGGILALGCVVPGMCVRLFELVKAGRHDDARALQRHIVPLARLLGPTYGVPGLKAALALIGCDLGVPRAPLARVPDTAIASIRETLAQYEELHVQFAAR
jgi:4-hydroxy-2-oxoglutarate aldolase